MTLLLIALTTYYLWSFISIYLPDLAQGPVAFVLIPLVAYGLSFLPLIALTSLAASGIVHLVANATQRAVPKQKRKSNIPPLP